MIEHSLRVVRLDNSGAYLMSLAEFGSSPFQDGGNVIHFTQTQRIFSDKQQSAQNTFSVFPFKG